MDAKLPSESARSEIRRYRANPVYYLLIWGVLGPALYPMVRFPPIAICIGPVILPALFFLTRWIYRLTIEITPGGIRVNIPNQTVETTWDNLVAVNFSFRESGFVTRFPMDSEGAHKFAATNDPSRLNAPAQGFIREYEGRAGELVSQQRYVPLQGFEWQLWHGDFVEQVERYAPQVRLRHARDTGGARTNRYVAWTLFIVPAVLAALIALGQLSHR